MIQIEFAHRVKNILEKDDNIIGLAAGGSWITDELDEFSDLDLIIITKEKITDNKTLMVGYAKRFGHFLSGFTGEHVGEPRLLICLYNDPLLHVDLKFLTADELESRVENPVFLLDKEGQLHKIVVKSKENFPYPDYQWIEDRFWVWIHYALLKIGRGEYLECLDFLSFLRMSVLGPLLHIKNNSLPRGVRKVETELGIEDLEALKGTIPEYERLSLLNSLKNAVVLYRELRNHLYDKTIELHIETEKSVLHYFDKIAKQ